MTDEAGIEIMHAVIEANKGLQLMMDGPAPWEKCCTVRVWCLGMDNTRSSPSLHVSTIVSGVR